MKVSLSWLKDFVDIDVDVETLADKLVGAGFEVEEIIDAGANMKNVVLGKIVELEKHPDADKLQICQIDVGGKELVQIVTGAQNVSKGDLVPVAMDNSLLPTGQEIKKGKLRGVPSNGMLCSGEELKLTESEYVGASVHGILIMNGEKYPLGTDMNVVLGNDDVVLDIGVTANRSDCNSVLGIAREVATVLNKTLKMPDVSFETDKSVKVSDIIDVDVEDKELCPRYMAAAVSDIKIQDSPEIIQKRLKSVGLRPINNIVDITNYVLIEIGQPMHAFDKNYIEGGKIIPRRAKNGEKIVALNEKEYVLDDTMLVICDVKKPCAIGGVMGGLNSGINDKTNTIIFESAKFLRDNIRRTSRKLNLHSDSSFRYERGIDFDSQRLGIMRALSLIYKYGFGKIADGLIDKLSQDLTRNKVETSVEEINGILGIEVPKDTVLNILNSLQIQSEIDKDGKLTCVCPAFRDDIENANDLAEEVIRLYGYDKVKSTLLKGGNQTLGGKNRQEKNIDVLKDICVYHGMSEILTYSFTTPKSFDILKLSQDDARRNCVKLLKPLGEDLSVMRTTLAYSMISTLASNCLKSNKKAKLFEIANVYLPQTSDMSQLPSEVNTLALGRYGEGEDFFTMKGIVEVILKKFGLNGEFKRADISYLHKGRSADIYVGKNLIGYLGEVHPEVAKSFDVSERMYIAELNVDMLNKLDDCSYEFVAISNYPPIERDIAVVVDESVLAGDLLACVRKGGGNLLVDAKIFDIYRNKEVLGENKKSVAISLVFRLAERTLTDEEVNAKINRILSKLSSEHNAVLR
ncbi:MAG: phenylalanine--tRNA ligase subunit beta [Clostridia bacterium]|jgi:phenylalanyl-tRNA synthetase beta chain|nr:phenylalanine--tRNA ligase subunit beta [Clostridia bacterium]MCI8944112.1 phenylalanine--tRNA ligase subunit beta [Clostridia bacterium]